MAGTEAREVRINARRVNRRRRIMRLILLIIILLLSLMSIVFVGASVLNKAGRFTINLDPDAFKYGLSISENKDFEEPSIFLQGTHLENMWNITQEWLLNDPNNKEYYAEGFPTYKSYDELDKVDGVHNGKDYIAYTFYIRNTGEENVGYYGSIDINSVVKGVDEAVRVMVFRNGVYTVYGKTPKNPRADRATFAIDEFFVDSSKVMEIRNKDFKTGEVDRYTIVLWLEGWDPECVNDIMGGAITLSMNFKILQESMNQE